MRAKWTFGFFYKVVNIWNQRSFTVTWVVLAMIKASKQKCPDPNRSLTMRAYQASTLTNNMNSIINPRAKGAFRIVGHLKPLLEIIRDCFRSVLVCFPLFLFQRFQKTQHFFRIRCKSWMGIEQSNSEKLKGTCIVIGRTYEKKHRQVQVSEKKMFENLCRSRGESMLQRKKWTRSKDFSNVVPVLSIIP